MYRPFPGETIAVCFYNKCTVISDKIGFMVSLILISVVHLYLNCTKVHPLAVFITLMLHYNLFYLFIYFRKLVKLCSISNKRKKKKHFYALL